MIDDRLSLFDDIQRDFLGPSKYSEPRWQYLNRTARPGYEYLRALLQNWFDNFVASQSKRERLCKEFQSDDNKVHLSAFFELYLYQLFKAQGFSIEVEPEWQQGCPDFLLTSSVGAQILVEATCIFPEWLYGSASQWEKDALDYLNDNLTISDSSLDIKIDSFPSGSPPLKQLAREIQARIDEVSHAQEDTRDADVDNQGMHPMVYTHDTWSIEFGISQSGNPQSGEPKSRAIGSVLKNYGSVDVISLLRSKIAKKNKQFGELSVPYILAINNLDEATELISNLSMIDALFGDDVTLVYPENGISSRKRLQNGSWYGPDGPRNTRMSGICYFRRLIPINVHTVEPVLWHHPYSRNPFESNQFPISQNIPNWVTRVYDRIEGMHPRDLLVVDDSKMPK
ncbi:MAG: hypothetical protein JNJ61_29030 [Anaerolineae bacterium]|nr:hypothetical protein [Anaerolineae bacterium]